MDATGVQELALKLAGAVIGIGAAFKAGGVWLRRQDVAKASADGELQAESVRNDELERLAEQNTELGERIGRMQTDYLQLQSQFIELSGKHERMVQKYANLMEHFDNMGQKYQRELNDLRAELRQFRESSPGSLL